MSEAVIGRIERAVNAAGRSAEFGKWLDAQGLEYGNATAKSFVEFERREQATVEDIMKRGGLQPQ
jgi:hypothetical protein